MPPPLHPINDGESAAIFGIRGQLTRKSIAAATPADQRWLIGRDLSYTWTTEAPYRAKKQGSVPADGV